MRECIRELDKSMSMKSNKAEMGLLKAELFDTFLKQEHWERLLAKFNVMKGEILSNQTNMETKL